MFTKRQLEDLEMVMHFIPPGFEDVSITEEDKRLFFEWSEKGKHTEGRISSHGRTGLWVLQEGKRWRGIHIHELYEPGIIAGDMPYFVILGGYKDKKRPTKWWNHWWYLITKNLWLVDPPPRSVVNLMKKEMFKGHDADLIEKVYQEVLMTR